jgi:hypothetical protein
MGEILLWGGGVAAFVIFPFAVGALVATPLLLAGEMFSGGAGY